MRSGLGLAVLLVVVLAAAPGTAFGVDFGFDPGLTKRCAWTPQPGQAKFFEDRPDCPGGDYGLPHWSLCAGGPNCSGGNCQHRTINGPGSPLRLAVLGGGCQGYTVDMRVLASPWCGDRPHQYFGWFNKGPFPDIRNLHSYNEIAMIGHSGLQKVTLDLYMWFPKTPGGTAASRVIGMMFPPFGIWNAAPGDEFPSDAIYFHTQAGADDYVTIDASKAPFGLPRLCTSGICDGFHAYDINWEDVFRHVQGKGIWVNAPPIDQIVPFGLSLNIETFDQGTAHIQHRKFKVYRP